MIVKWHIYILAQLFLRICFSVVAADCVVDILYRDHLRPYLFCLGREEAFRLELATNLREVFTISEKAPTSWDAKAKVMRGRHVNYIES